MSKVSYATFVDVGLVGPKARPEGVVDGQAVNILLPWQNRFKVKGKRRRKVPGSK